MDRQERLKNYFAMKEQRNLKEYIFMTRAGYRHFFALGNTLKEAEENFMRSDQISRCGFSLEDLPIRLEYDKEKCKDWTIEDFWLHNENKHEIISGK